MKLRHQLLLLLTIGGALFFVELGRLPLTEPDEGRNAEVAREMLVQHDWITPHYDTLPYLDKPVVFFWLVASSFRAFGISEWAARLPSALAALLTMLVVWLLARSIFGESCALKAAVVFATCPLVIVFARVVIFDMTLTLLLTITMAAFWLSRNPGRMQRPLQCVMFAAAGIATVTKGPVGIVLPVLAIVVYAAAQRKFGELRRLAWPPGLALFLAASLPWFIAVSLRNPGFPRYALWDESLVRFAGGHLHRGGSVFYYIPVFLAGLLPWSLLLVFASLNRLRSWRQLRDDGHAAQAYLLSWAVVVFVFFSASHSKLPGYFLPAIPALAILMGRVWTGDVDEGAARRRPDWLTAGFAALIAVGLLLAVAPTWFRTSSVSKMAAHKIHPAVLALLPPSVFYSGLILAALGILGRNLSARSRGQLATAGSFAVFAVAIPLLAVRCWPAIQAYARASSTKNLANTISQGPERELPLYGYYYFRTSLPFYLRRPVGLVTSDGDELTSNYIISRWPTLSRNPQMGPGKKAAPLFITGAELSGLGRSSAAPFLVLVQNHEVGNIVGLGAAVEPLWTAWKYSVWKVSPEGKPTAAPAGPGLQAAAASTLPAVEH
ncbi:MAG TPA: glycosyltransferase family 39 protein [Terriglobia bacterium]|nr:glycosyltransferase family 39 protein [Terriglobia bacterium]